MNVFDRYFQRNKVVEYSGFSDDIALIVIIPVFDDPDIFGTLQSLSECYADEGKTGVIVVVNYPEVCEEEAKLRSRAIAKQLKLWMSLGGSDEATGKVVEFLVLEAFDLPQRVAGVGLARKIAMDVAADYFYRKGEPDGIIASLDADTLVERGYLNEIILFFRENPVAGVSVAYEHRLGEVTSVELRDAIVKYELYLRYYQLALRYTGHPHAFHCIGSAFAVRARDYVAQGGMNRRQAGEDFYFLQKLITTGRYAELNSTKVYPSARISGRTPFGTGQSVRQIAEDGGRFLTYDFDAFRILCPFFSRIPVLYKAGKPDVDVFVREQPEVLRRFLSDMDFESVIEEVNGNCASEKQFIRRFFDNFNAFRVLKYLNYAHNNGYDRIEIVCAVNAFLDVVGKGTNCEAEELLKILRRWQ